MNFNKRNIISKIDMRKLRKQKTKTPTNEGNPLGNDVEKQQTGGTKRNMKY